METTDTKKVILPMSEYEYLKAREKEANEIKAELLKEDKDRKYIVIKVRDFYYNFSPYKSMQIWSESEVLNDAQREIDRISRDLNGYEERDKRQRDELRNKVRKNNTLYDAIYDLKEMTLRERVFKWGEMKKKMESVLNEDY